ncbi:MAG: hypothetical protein J6C64_00345 [Lachnospiraceae bacterium]|nr:hypothetical protein [Lachnospiraceae bacterium]
MPENIRLGGDYIRVRRKKNGELTYGGDQGFFQGNENRKQDKRKQMSGCGVVALSDILLYLAGRREACYSEESVRYAGRILDEEEYKEYYNSIYELLGGIRSGNGISGLNLKLKFNKLSRKNNWSLRALWGLNGEKIYIRMEEMLKNDIPVILCIPMMLLKKDKNDRLNFYGGKEIQSVNAHYVVVTGVFRKPDGESYLEISSWGKKYYINRNEYDTFIHTHFMGTILGNILYIRQK